MREQDQSRERQRRKRIEILTKEDRETRLKEVEKRIEFAQELLTDAKFSNDKTLIQNYEHSLQTLEHQREQILRNPFQTTMF